MNLDLLNYMVNWQYYIECIHEAEKMGKEKRSMA